MSHYFCFSVFLVSTAAFVACTATSCYSLVATGRIAADPLLITFRLSTAGKFEHARVLPPPNKNAPSLGRSGFHLVNDSFLRVHTPNSISIVFGRVCMPQVGPTWPTDPELLRYIHYITNNRRTVGRILFCALLSGLIIAVVIFVNQNCHKQVRARVTDEKKYFQETGVRQLKAVEIQHAGEHREPRLLRLQQILRILASWLAPSVSLMDRRCYEILYKVLSCSVQS